MWLCLLLALALLGTVPARHPGECPPHPCPLLGTLWGHPQTPPPQCHAWSWRWVPEGPLVPTLPLLCPSAPRQLQGVPAGDTPRLHYTVVKKLRTYASAQVRGHGAHGGHGGHGAVPGASPVPVAQRYCQDVYRGQLASVHSSARNQELQKLAQTYKILSPWIGAVTSRKVRGHRRQGAAEGVLGAGEEG